MRNARLLWIGFVLGAAACGSHYVSVDSEASTASLHAKYMRACIDHDLRALEILTSPDAVRRYGPYTFVGREEVLGPDAFEAGLDSR